MEKGGIVIKIEKEWEVSSKVERVRKGEELINMAGRWGVGIDVHIIKPYTYSQGPVEKIVISEGIHKREKARYE